MLGLFILLCLFRGGNTPGLITLVALVSLLTGFLTCLAAASRRFETQSIPAAWHLFAAAIVIVALTAAITLIPVQIDTWLSLPGRSIYALAAETLLAPPLSLDVLAVSIDPAGSRRAVAAMIPVITILVIALIATRSAWLSILGTLAVLAIFEAIIGLLQIGFGNVSILNFDGLSGGRVAKGTFVNRNHYATLLAMMLPLLLLRSCGYFAFSLKSRAPSSLSNIWWGFGAAVVAIGLLASISRAGTLAGAFASLVAVLLCATRKQSFARRLALMAVAIIVIGLGSVFGLSQLTAALSASTLQESVSGRFAMTSVTIAAAMQLFPLGSGLGTYAIAFQPFQPHTVMGYIEHAHNEYAQIVFETGLIGLIALTLLALAFFVTARRAVQLELTATSVGPSIGCTLGCLAFAIHSWFDFPGRIPLTLLAVSMLACAAIMLSSNNLTRDQETANHRRRKPVPVAETALKIASGTET